MRRMTYFVMALAMVLGFTQCKKEQAPANNETEGVFITLDVNGGNNGSRVIVDPTGNNGEFNYATVTFEDGDVIYVGYKGAYVGSLTYSGGTFSGSVSISEGDYGEKLHFYFLGGKGFTPTFVGNTATVNISNQTERYPVISYNTSNESFTGAGSYSAKLLNKVSIMKFNVTTPSSAAICITGMNNKVTLNFNPSTENTDQGFSYSIDEADGGLIKMIGGSGTEENPAVKWAIVLPQEDVLAGTAGTAYTDDGMCTGTRPAIDEIGSNQYLSDGVTMYVNEFTPLGTPLTLEALGDGTIVVDIVNIIGGKGGGVYPGSSKGGPGGGKSSNISMKYSVNGGAKNLIDNTTTIDVNAGDKVQLYGNGPDMSNHYVPNISGGTAQVKVYGNIMSMLDEDNYATLTTLQDFAFYGLFAGFAGNNTTLTDASGLLLPATTLTEWCYFGLFFDCTSLTTAPALPATELAEQCYTYMFNGCTSLTTAPTLPATTLAGGCYSGMFDGCTSLTTAPALPATTLANGCYSEMFYDCTSLTTAPALPATTLASSCYSSMFSGCTSLTTAPALPAETLASECYSYMFYGCTSLNSITCLATEGINENESTSDWVNGVASTGTFNRASGATWPTGNNGIPNGWTLVPPATPAHEYVDLGLPSGLLWATCNVGADTPEAYGDYFAWGETTTKSTYNWSTYQYCNGSDNTLTKYCTDASYGYNGFTDNLTTLLPEDDAAAANWGGNWRMPTKEEFQELYDNTTATWTQQGGVNGWLFTANNNSLFLPAAGYYGNYWSSSLITALPHGAWSFGFDSMYYDVSGSSRNEGQSVRPVREN